MGVISAIGQGKAAFVNALLDGETAFGVMQRPGRQGESAYLGAEIGEITFSTGIARQTLRAASLSAQAALEQVNIPERQKHFPAQLSGGQQQRVAIARALVGKPKVLLADEPTGNLDSKNARLVMDLLDQLHNQGSTIVMVTHDPRFAERADRQVSLFDGKIMDDRRLPASSTAVTVGVTA